MDKKDVYQNLTSLMTKEVHLSELDGRHYHGIHDFCAVSSQLHLRSNLEFPLLTRMLMKFSVVYTYTHT